jgi:hypothetical protein
MAINYLAANEHSLGWQNQAANWSQQRALNTNQVAFDQASSGMNLANQVTGIGMNANTAQTAIRNNQITGQAVVSASKDILSGLVTSQATPIIGGLANANADVFNALLAHGANTDSMIAQNNAARMTNAAQVGQAGYLRDTNKNLADWAARGDYQTSIAGINAKIQDASLIQPSVSGQTGGDTFNLVNNNTVVSARFKMIDHANMRIVGEYWLRYGYSVRQFYTPPSSLQCMSHFTYWKMLETYINTGPMPEGFKQIIRGIFEKGVTVWSNPNNIGNIDLAINQPLTGITLP